MRYLRKKSFSKIMVIIIAVFIVFIGSVLGFVHAQTETEDTSQIYVGDFNLYEYKADTYLKDGVCKKNIQNMLTSTNPSRIIVEHLDKDSVFQTAVSGWKIAHYATSPSEIAEGAIDEKGYYTAIILSVFKAETDNSNVIFDTAKNVSANTNKVLSNMKKWVEASDNIELEKVSKNQILSTLSIDESKEIQTYLTRQFKTNHPSLNGSSTLASDIAAVFDAVNTLGEAIELLESYIQISEMSAGMKAVLLNMYNSCPDSNIAMKSALYEAALSTENLNSAIKATVLNTAGKETEQVIGVLLDEGWDNLIKLNPYAKAFMIGAEVGTWLGDAVCSTLFSTDKTIEQYEKMKCLNEFTSLLKTTVTDMGDTYLNNKSTQNAENYFAAIDALYSAADLSCEFAIDYGKILYEDAALGWVAISQADYDEYIKSIKSIKQIYNELYESLTGSYLAELEYEYPEIYKILMGHNSDEDIVPVTGISFSSDSMVIGMNPESIYMLDTPIIYPSNASNCNVIYTSSDETIVGTNGYFGFLTPKKEGTVTITATTEDGGYTDSIVVTVSKEENEIWNNINVSDIVESGSCGNDVEWALNEKGTLNIYGSGRMDDYYYTRPWNSFEKDIKKVIIRGEVTSIGDSAFEDCSSLTSISIPEGVTSIGNYAFSGCSSLASISLPAGVTSIGGSAFEDCSSLASISLPAEITSIENWTFEDCSSLTSISIPAGVTSIGGSAFWGCSNLTSISLPAGVTSIGDSAFWGCSNLTSISLPAGVTSIGGSAFEDCSSLTSISIPEGVTSIGDSAFNGCSRLTSINIPDGVTSIGYSAFCGCSNLTSINIPEGVTSIGGSAFNGCSRLTSINIPDGVTSIGYSAFCGCSNLTSINIPDGVTSIGDSAFAGCSSLASISLPAEITSIENWTFEDCSSLTSISIPAGVTSIGGSAFCGCSNLTSINIPDGVISIGSSAFRECSSLTSISIPDGVISIGDATFEDCNSLTSISIPDGVTSIGDDAFRGCSSLTSISLPDGVTSIGGSAFSGCSSLTSISIPEGVTNIGYYAFSWCSSLTSISIPEGVTSIEDGAFFGCSSLTGINIPEGVTYIGDYAFSGCRSLTDINILEGVTSIGDYAFYDCSNLTSIAIPESLTSIGDWAFWGCSSLTNISIPAVVTSIGHGAFRDCRSLTSISLPDGVTSIEYEAFSGCEKLENVEIPKGITSIGDNAFFRCYNLVITCNEDSYAWTYAIDNKISLLINEFCVKVNEDGSQFTIECFTGDKTNLQIPDVINGIKVTSIGDWAFADCRNLTNINIPEGVTSIENGAFSGCSSLTSISIPEGVTSIGDHAFDDCSNLTSIVIPESLTSIGDWAFSGCNSLTSISLPEGITSIGDYMFVGCSSLTNISIPAVVTSIGHGAFRDCSSLTSISLPDGVTSIGYDAFSGCSSLTSISIPEGVTSIGNYAFWDCDNLVITCNKDSYAYTYAVEYGIPTVQASVVIPDIPITGIKFVNKNITLKIGKTCQLQVVVSPANATNKGVTYISSDNKVATVDAKGLVKAVSAGTADITVTTIDGGYQAKATIKVSTVNEPSIIEVTGISLKNSNINLQTGKTNQLQATVIPSIATNKGVNYQSSNTKVATVDAKGLVTAVSAGTADITVTTIDGGYQATATIKVSTVNEPSFIEVTGISLKNSNINLQTGKTYQLQTTVTPVDATNKGVNYQSSNTKVATVNAKGLVTAVSAGTADITVTTIDGGYQAKAMIKVSNPAKKTQTIKASKTKYTIVYGNKAFKLGVKTTGDGKLTYKSSDTKVVKVSSSGKVTIKGTGKATITIKAAETGNYKASSRKISITVKPKQMAIKKLMSPKKGKLKVNWAKDSKVSGYEITIAANNKFTKGKKTYKVMSYKTMSKTINKLKSRKMYYVRIRGYKTVKGSKTPLYGKYSKVRKIKVK